jgi:phage repressor protein C with HTH and peptisase S24 domain
MSFSDNLRRFRKAAGLTQEGLALACGWPGQSRIANYEKGIREPTFEEAASIAGVLQISSADLMGDPLDSHRKPEWADVKGYAQAVGLGDGAEAQEYAETHRLKFRADSLARKGLVPAGLAVMYGAGDSMLPRLHPGDAILFDQSDTRPRDGCLYVIQVHGAANAEYQVKRAMILEDVVYFVADNPAGDHCWKKPRKADAKRGHIEIIGRVRWVGSWED